MSPVVQLPRSPAPAQGGALSPTLFIDKDAQGRRRFTAFDSDGAPVRSLTRWANAVRLRSPRTAETYAKNVTYIGRWMRESGLYTSLSLDQAFSVMTRFDIESWVEGNGHLDVGTLHNRECALKEFLEWLTSEDADNLRKPEETPYLTGKMVTSSRGIGGLPTALTEAEVIRLINGLHNEAERCLVHFMFDAGLRISEVCRAAKKHLPDPRDFVDGQKYLPLHVEGSKGAGGRQKPRQTIISAPVLARVQRLHASHKPYRQAYPDISAPENPLFLSATGQRLTARNLLNQMKAAARRAGINPAKVPPHVMRHSFAMYLLLADDLDEQYGNRRMLLMRCLGHGSVKAGDVYAKLLPSVLARAREERLEKYAQAQRVFDATYLAPRRHTERRGHGSRNP